MKVYRLYNTKEGSSSYYLQIKCFSDISGDTIYDRCINGNLQDLLLEIQKEEET